MISLIDPASISFCYQFAPVISWKSEGGSGDRAVPKNNENKHDDFFGLCLLPSNRRMTSAPTHFDPARVKVGYGALILILTRLKKLDVIPAL